MAGADSLASWESSPGIHRFFAECCGSPIYKRRDDIPALLGLRLGTLDTDPGRRVQEHIFTSSKVPWVEIDDGPMVLIATYQSVVLTGPTDYIRIDTVDAGLAALDAAMEQYLAAASPIDYPTIVFYSSRELGDIDPSPTAQEPFIMTWDGCLSMRVDFTQEYDIYDVFPGE